MVESVAHLESIATGLCLASVGEWWSGLTPLIKGFYLAAMFFSVLFAWQLLGILIGLGGSHDLDVDADAGGDFDVDHPELDHSGGIEAVDTMAAFKLLSVRSILAFFMLFTWAGALYMDQGVPVGRAMTYAMLWGTASMLLVAGVFYLMRRMTESGSQRIATCLGTRGTVYLDIPKDGMGEVRVTVSGVLTHVKARSFGGHELPAGTPVRVKRVLGPTSVEVMPATD